MKKTFTILALSVLAGVAIMQQSCVDAAKHLFNEFNTKPHEVRFRVPIIPTSGGDFVVLDTVQTRIDLDEEIRNSSGGTYGIGDIESITIHSIRLTLDSADVLNSWNNFTDLEFKLISPTYHFKETIGSKHDIWEGFSSELTLDASGESVNVHQYLSGDILYEISGRNRRPTTKELYGTAYVTFMVR